jgi:hypothetical protein
MHDSYPVLLFEIRKNLDLQVFDLLQSGDDLLLSSERWNVLAGILTCPYAIFISFGKLNFNAISGPTRVVFVDKNTLVHKFKI